VYLLLFGVKLRDW